MAVSAYIIVTPLWRDLPTTNQSDHHPAQMSHSGEGDQDSLFGSPPPSPVRGRSPATVIPIDELGISPGIATPSSGDGTSAPEKNVGTIALPGSHMSCSELPANLSAARLSLPHASGLGPLSLQPHDRDRTPASTSSGADFLPGSRSSRAGSVFPAPRSSVSSTSSAPPVRKRKSTKAKSATPVATPPPITIPGPDEPTPPNFLRSQSALLGVAGVVGSVKPTHLHTHEPGLIHPRSSRAVARDEGSTPANPIVVDDDDSRSGQRSVTRETQLDQVDLGGLHGDVLVTLAKQKNIFPVLKSLVGFVGGPPIQPQPESFARPYNHGIRDTSVSTSADSTDASASRSITVSTDVSDDQATPTPPHKRRKLTRVPAGAADWDVPFPFASGEGPEAYQDNWAQERRKQLAIQLLEVLKDAVEKTMARKAKKSLRRGRGRVEQSRKSGEQNHPIRSVSVGDHDEPSGMEMTAVPHVQQPTAEVVDATGASVLSTAAEGDPASPLNRFLAALCGSEPSARGLSEELDTLLVEGSREHSDGRESVPFDPAEFEEWLAQLEAFVPPDPSICGPEWGSSGAFPHLGHDNATTIGFDDSSMPGPSRASTSWQQQTVDSSAASQTVTDDLIDPALLALSFKQATSSQPHSIAIPTPPTIQPQLQLHEHIAPTPPPPPLTFSPRTSLSSFTEPLTPHSDAFGEPAIHVSTGGDQNQDHVRILSSVIDSAEVVPRPCSPTHEQPIVPSTAAELSQTQHPQRLSAIQKGKARATTAPAPRTNSGISGSTSKGARRSVVKDDILERARERRRQLAAEIERAKIELWESSIEGGVLIHLAKDSSL